MRLNAKLSVGDLVVFNHQLDAAVFRVIVIGDTGLEGIFRVGVIDRSLENLPIKQAIQWVDKASILPLSFGQLARLK